MGSLALLLLRSDDHVFIRRIALIVSVAEFLFSLLLLRGATLASGDYRLVEYGQWITTPPIHYHLGVDGISLFLVILTTFLTPISVIASWSSIGIKVTLDNSKDASAIAGFCLSASGTAPNGPWSICQYGGQPPE